MANSTRFLRLTALFDGGAAGFLEQAEERRAKSSEFRTFETENSALAGETSGIGIRVPHSEGIECISEVATCRSEQQTSLPRFPGDVIGGEPHWDA
jgi:hypothetical protein